MLPYLSFPCQSKRSCPGGNLAQLLGRHPLTAPWGIIQMGDDDRMLRDKRDDDDDDDDNDCCITTSDCKRYLTNIPVAN